LTTDWVLGQFGQRRAVAHKRYRQFVAEGRGVASPWEQVTGQVYLGSEAFVARHQPNELIREVPRRQTHAQRPSLHVLLKPGRPQAQAIRTAYRRYGYRLAEIASHVGVHYSTVSRWLQRAEQVNV
jgi:DNA-directed RNA polymerase specialized sigma24 family protein